MKDFALPITKTYGFQVADFKQKKALHLQGLLVNIKITNVLKQETRSQLNTISIIKLVI